MIEKVVGGNIRTWREVRGYSQTDLADLAGLTRSSISNAEAGRQNLRLTVLADIAAALDVPAAELLRDQHGLPYTDGWKAGQAALRARLAVFLTDTDGR